MRRNNVYIWYILYEKALIGIISIQQYTTASTTHTHTHTVYREYAQQNFSCLVYMNLIKRLIDLLIITRAQLAPAHYPHATVQRHECVHSSLRTPNWIKIMRLFNLLDINQRVFMWMC